MRREVTGRIEKYIKVMMLLSRFNRKEGMRG
jgi:hypothetical protein